MKKPLNPVVAGAVALTAGAGICYLLYYLSFVRGVGDTQLPPNVVQAIRAKGPQPMPPMPMPNGRYFSGPRALEMGPPPEAVKHK